MAQALWKGAETFDRGRRHASKGRSSFLYEGESGAASLPEVVDSRIADPLTFRMATTRVVVGDLALHEVDVTPFASRRSPALIAASPWPSVLIGHAGRGALEIAQAGKSNVFGRGDLFLVRTDEEFDFAIRERWVGETMSIALTDLREEGEALEQTSLSKIQVGRSAAAAALATIQTMTTGYHGVDGAAGALFELGLVAMIRSAIAQAGGQQINPQDRADAARLGINRYLEIHFGDSLLTTARVADAFGLSERSLQRLFEDGESVTVRLRAIRTEFLVCALRSSTLPFDSLSARAGFGSTASARRALAELTGKTPQELRTR